MTSSFQWRFVPNLAFAIASVDDVSLGLPQLTFFSRYKSSYKRADPKQVINEFKIRLSRNNVHKRKTLSLAIPVLLQLNSVYKRLLPLAEYKFIPFGDWEL